MRGLWDQGRVHLLLGDQAGCWIWLETGWKGPSGAERCLRSRICCLHSCCTPEAAAGQQAELALDPACLAPAERPVEPPA